MEGVIAREQIWKKLELLNIWQQQMVVALIDSLVEVQSAAARRDKNRLLSLSIWTEQGIQQIEEAQKKVNAWQLPRY